MLQLHGGQLQLGNHHRMVLMLQHVQLQGFVSATGEVAVLASKRLLSRMSHLVLLQVVLGAAGIAALAALERFLVFVNEQVLVEVRGFSEGGTAERAEVRLEAGMLQPVAVKTGPGAALVVAVWALVRCLVLVSELVVLELLHGVA